MVKVQKQKDRSLNFEASDKESEDSERLHLVRHRRELGMAAS